MFVAVLGASVCGKISGKEGYQQIVITKVCNLIKNNNSIDGINGKIVKVFFLKSNTMLQFHTLNN